MVLRNVPKTFTFEEQRVEINEIAQDLHSLATQELNDIELTSFQVSVQAAGSANLVYDDSTGVFSYTPPDLSLYLTNETDPVFTSHPSFSITSQNINDWTAATVLVNNNHGVWTTAYGWGDHGIVGYLTSNVISTNDTPPTSPVDGTLWWNSDDGQLKVYYDDGNSSQWVDARTTLPGVELINDLSDVDSSSPSNGDILKWVDANGKWEAAAETAFSGITHTELYIGTPNNPSLLGALSYDNAGTFTYTPPDLSAYWVTNNAEIINWNTSFGWGNHAAQGYLTGIGSLSVGALLDVDVTTTAPNAGEGLVWDNVTSKWIPGVVGGSGAGLDQAQVRSSISVIKPNPTASGSGDVTYSSTSGEFTYTPPNLQPYLTSYTETDPVFSASDASNVTNAKIANWDTAYGWGDHGAAGYLTSLGDAAGVTTAKITNWDTAYGWGDHSAAGYLTSLGDAAGVTSAKITNWDTAYGWGDHSAAGYLTSIPSSTLDDYVTKTGTTLDINYTGNTSHTSGGYWVLDAVGQIQLKSDSYLETQSTRVEFKNAADDEILFKATAGQGCQLYYNNVESLNTQDGGVKVIGYLKDKDDSQGIAGEILSSTGSELEWIAAPTAGSSFDSGTRMLFQQSSAPTDWVKDTSSNNNSALRIVTGAASTGGNVDFTTAFTNSRTPSGTVTVTVNGRTLSTSQMPSHAHKAYNHDLAALAHGGTKYLGDSNGAGGGTGSSNTDSKGGNSSHDHSSSGNFSGNAMDFDVKYTDVIVAIKS